MYSDGHTYAWTHTTQKHSAVSKYVQNKSSDAVTCCKQMQDICACKKCISAFKYPLFERLLSLQLMPNSYLARKRDQTKSKG